VDMGQGVHAALARLASEQLGIPMEQIFVTYADTEGTPYEQATSASRTTMTVGRMVEHAAQQLRAQLAETFCQVYEMAPALVKFVDGHLIGDSQRVPIGEVVARRVPSAGGEMLAHVADPGTRAQSSSMEAAVGGAEIEVDPETGELQVLRYVSADFVGKAINELQARGQNEGAVVFGLGHALSEEMIYSEDGHLMNSTMMDYRVPTARHLPEELIAITIEDRGGAGPGGARGIGESCVLPVMPAIANAVHDATGVRFTEMPLTPQRIAARVGTRGA
jgi:CO/xanthine dehydrogenase Mo-binding subunit